MTDAAVCRDDQCTGRHCVIPSCGRHTDPDTFACVHCTGAARRWLKTIPEHAARISVDLDGWSATSPGISPSSSRNAEQPLVGGDRLALISPGGDGRNARGHDHAVDNLPSDPPSVLAALESWERDWRETMHITAADQPATLTNVTGWLGRNLNWATRHHPAFDDFWRELRTLHGWLERAAGDTVRPVVGFVDCIDCRGVRLRREWLRDGLDDLWLCPKCRRRYLVAEYHFALRAHLEERENTA